MLLCKLQNHFSNKAGQYNKRRESLEQCIALNKYKADNVALFIYFPDRYESK